MRLQLRHLQHAVALADENSYTAAARRLNLSQPALSRSIQSLEELLGTTLFDRSAAGIVPTAIGALVVERGRALLQEASSVEREIGLALGLETGSLTLGAGMYPANISVGKACGLLLREHPGLKLDVKVNDWQVLVQAVLEDKLDLAVIEISTLADHPLLDIEALPQHQGYFICNAQHPLAHASSLSVEDIMAFPLVTSSLPERVTSITTTIRVDTFQLLRDIIWHSNAIGIATASQIEADERAGRLLRLSVRLPWMHSHYGFVRLKDRTPSPAARAFMQRLRDVEATLANTAPTTVQQDSTSLDTQHDSV